jgi:hypothetical protein
VGVRAFRCLVGPEAMGLAKAVPRIGWEFKDSMSVLHSRGGKLSGFRRPQSVVVYTYSKRV